MEDAHGSLERTNMQTVLDFSVNVLGWAMIASFAWSMKHHFDSGAFPLGAKLLSGAVIGCGLALGWTLSTAEQPLVLLLAGLALQGLGGALFWWAIAASRAARLRFVFDADTPSGLITAGPYRLIRHPFYASYLLFWIGWSLASASPFASAIVAFFAFAYTAASSTEEQSFARSALADDYRRYRAATGRFWPRLRDRSVP
jgi:protein-S-isoprenylcysteine O-methyltransferase Ste14